MCFGVKNTVTLGPNYITGYRLAFKNYYRRYHIITNTYTLNKTYKFTILHKKYISYYFKTSYYNLITPYANLKAGLVYILNIGRSNSVFL